MKHFATLAFNAEFNHIEEDEQIITNRIDVRISLTPQRQNKIIILGKANYDEWEFLIWHLKHKKGLFLFAKREFEHTWGEIHRISEIINSLKFLKARTVRRFLH